MNGWRWIPVLLLWILACANLSVHWSANPIYSYGWLVPVFAAYALFLRIRSRPIPGPRTGWAKWMIVLAGLAFAPTWLFAQPNPDWSLVAWLLVGEVVVITLGMVGLVGGWAWVRHFAFPICFIFTAVPCPHVIEAPMTVGLMRAVATFTVELLNVCGVAAVQHGNVIEVRSGLLGVDEACSGVRSLQAALTGSLFIGEMFRLNVLRRFGLLFGGLVVALLTNVARTFFLSWSASREGSAAVDRWHDPAGFTILTACFVIIWILAFLMTRGERPPAETTSKEAGSPLPTPLVVGLAIWIAAILCAVEMWFYDPAGAQQSAWSLVPPAGSAEVPIGAEAARQLQCDRMSASSWRTPDGGDWMLYFLEWRPGPVRSRVLARVHRPEICLSSVGLKLVEDRGTLWVEAGGFNLPFRAYTFEQAGRTLFVYYGIWQSRSRRAEMSGRLSESEHSAGFQAVLWRERNLGQQVAELAVTGYSSAAQADASFEETVKRLLVRRLPEVAER